MISRWDLLLNLTLFRVHALPGNSEELVDGAEVLFEA